MSFKSRFYATAALVAYLSFAPLAPAQAGQLFPPSNIGTNPNVTCPNGQVLGWTGDAVACINPTLGVTVSCPAGQVLTGITNGVPVCVVFNGGDNGGGSSVGWVSVPLDPNTGWADEAPEAICQAAGYTTFTGACKGFGGVSGNRFGNISDAYQGSVASGSTSFDLASFNCTGFNNGANGGYAQSEVPSHILCIK